MTQYNNGFSWERVKMVAAYYYPVIKPQMIWYPIVVALLYGLALLCQTVDWLAPVGVALTGPFSFMFYFAPIILARRDCRLVTTMLPATAAEKMAVLAVYFFVVVPVLIFGVEYALVGITELVIPEYNFIMAAYNAVGKDLSGLFMFSQLDELIPAVTCFWGIIYFKENRTLKSILVAGGSLIALGVLGAVYGIIYVAKEVIDAQAAGVAIKEEQISDNLAMHMANHMEPFLIGIGVVAVVYAAVMIWLSYRRVKSYQN